MIIFLVICSYLMGSIPSGYLLIKYKYGQDIRNCGSGNIGATNVSRCYGKNMGNLTKICDIGKAFFPMITTDLLIKGNIVSGNKPILLTLVAIATILGHNYSIFLKFKGGKGVATTVGSFVYILPIPMLFAAVMFFGLKLITKVVSIRAMISCFVLFITTWLLDYNTAFVYGTFIILILMIIRHKSNIKRIINGEEK